MKKKVVVMMLALTLTASLGLAGCGSKQEAPTQQTEDTQQADSDTETTDETTDDTQEDQDTEDDADQKAADEVAALIDAIYVQERTDDTDAQCAAAKEAWDALTDAQKALV